MALLSIFRGTQAECSARSVSDGTLLFATDTKKIYLDKDSSRIEMSSVDDLGNYVTKEQLTTALNDKANTKHTHTIADTTGLQEALDGKASFTDIDGIAVYVPKYVMDAALAQQGIATPLDYANAKTLMANAGMFYQDGAQCVNVLAMAEVINALCEQIDANATTAAGKADATHTHVIADVTGLQTALDGKADKATTLAGYGIRNAYTKNETDTAITTAITWCEM